MVIAGWEAPKPDTIHLRVNVKRWNIYDDLDPLPLDDGEYSALVASGDENRWLELSDGDDPDEFDCDSDAILLKVEQVGGICAAAGGSSG